MANKKGKVEQPSKDLKEMLSDLMTQEPEVIEVRGKKYRIGWLKKYTMLKMSRIVLKEKNPWKQSVKACTCVLLNKKGGLRTRFNLKFRYPLLWRWLYYVKDIDQVEVMQILEASKKKVQSTPLALATILVTEMTETMLMMITAAHESGPAGPNGGKPTP